MFVLPFLVALTGQSYCYQDGYRGAEEMGVIGFDVVFAYIVLSLLVCVFVWVLDGGMKRLICEGKS